MSKQVIILKFWKLTLNLYKIREADSYLYPFLYNCNVRKNALIYVLRFSTIKMNYNTLSITAFVTLFTSWRSVYI